MLIVYPKQMHESSTNDVATEPLKNANPVNPADWPYMQMSGEILATPPATWLAYPQTTEGLRAVIDMEYQELKNAIATGKEKQTIMRELVHLGSATLALWRLYNAE